jgi:hypothetical protein
MSCDHEWEPYPTETIVVTEEQASAQPLRFNWEPERIVPCKKCGAPIDRGRYDRAISHPWAGLR